MGWMPARTDIMGLRKLIAEIREKKREYID